MARKVKIPNTFERRKGRRTRITPLRGLPRTKLGQHVWGKNSSATRDRFPERLVCDPYTQFLSNLIWRPWFGFRGSPWRSLFAISTFVPAFTVCSLRAYFGSQSSTKDAVEIHIFGSRVIFVVCFRVQSLQLHREPIGSPKKVVRWGGWQSKC